MLNVIAFMKLLIICWLAMSTVLLAGCASSNVNPSTPHHDTGYVDFYVGDTNVLYWDVTDNASNKKLFSEFAPLQGPILRLGFKPGQYQFQVTFLNRVITTAGTADVEVRDGMVTPVMVRLKPTGAAVVQSKSLEIGTSYYGRIGRRTRTRETQSVNYKIITEPQMPLPYQRKDRMPYFHPQG